METATAIRAVLDVLAGMVMATDSATALALEKAPAMATVAGSAMDSALEMVAEQESAFGKITSSGKGGFMNSVNQFAEAPTDPAIEIPGNTIEDGDLCNCGDLDLMTCVVSSSCESFGRSATEDPYEGAADDALREAIGWSLMILASVVAIVTAAVATWCLT